MTSGRIVRVIRERYTVEDDGAGGSMSVETSTNIDEETCADESGSFEHDGRTVRWFESAARGAVAIIRRESLGYGADGGEWFGRAEISTVDYSTGEEERVTAHLDGEWTDTERRAIVRMTEWLDRRDKETARRYSMPAYYGAPTV